MSSGWRDVIWSGQDPPMSSVCNTLLIVSHYPLGDQAACHKVAHLPSDDSFCSYQCPQRTGGVALAIQMCQKEP